MSSDQNAPIMNLAILLQGEQQSRSLPSMPGRDDGNKS